MTAGVRIAFALGLGAVIALIATQGAGAIASLLAGAGWKLMLLVPLQILPLSLDVLGWRAVLLARVRFSALFVIACIRQAINRLLPVANVGGEIVGIRLLLQQGADGTVAAASVIVELMLSLFAQYCFVALGVAVVFPRINSSRLMQGMIIGLFALLAMLALMLILLKHGKVFRRIEAMAVRVFGRWLDGRQGFHQGAKLDAVIHQITADGARLLRALAWQFSGLIVGCSETWLALRWLGHPVGFSDAIVLESLTQAAKSLLFMVPSALGVQEAGLIGAGLLLGLDADVALALSLAKRMREILFGVPSLLAWQWIEGRRLFLQFRGRSGRP